MCDSEGEAVAKCICNPSRVRKVVAAEPILYPIWRTVLE